MYLSKGNAKVYFDNVADFLRTLVLPPANLVLNDVACKICVELCECDSECNSWDLDLVEVVSITRRFPLVNIQWNLVPFGHSKRYNDMGFATLVSTLKRMDNRDFENLSSAALLLHDEPFGAVFEITLKNYCTEQDFKDIELRIGGLQYECGGIIVDVRERSGILESKHNVSASEEDA